MRVLSPLRWIRQRLVTLKSQPALAAVLFALILTICVGDATLIFYLRDQALSFGARETQNLAYTLSEQTEKTLRSVQIVTSVLGDHIESARPTSVEEFERIASGPFTKDVQRGSSNGAGHVEYLSVISARGKLLDGGDGRKLPDVDLADREYLRGARESRNGDLYIGMPARSRITGEWSFFLAKAVRSPTGEFLGAVTAVSELRTLEDLYSRIKLGAHGSIWMARDDGVVLVRFPRLASAIGKSMKRDGALAQIFFNQNDDVAAHVSPADGRRRIAAVHHVRGFPVAMVVTAAVDDVLSEWNNQAVSLTFGGAGAVMALSLLALILSSATEQLARTRSELNYAQEREETQGRLFAAISNMRQGLAMFDAAGTLIVCNRQYVDLYKVPAEVCIPGTPRETLHQHRRLRGTVRKSQSALAPGQLLNELIDGRMIAITEQALKCGGFVSTHEDVTEQRRAEEKMLRLARHDPLTDLPNRMVFKEALRSSLEGLPNDRLLAVHYLDLDGFKLVNDTLGHPAGDDLLKLVARRLAATMRSGDVLARLGGDEFAILQSVVSRDEAERLACRVNHVFSRPFDLEGQAIRMGACLGISLALEDARDADQLIKNADLALYAAKAAGRNVFRFFTPEMAAASHERLQLERELREALSTGELDLYYQPQVRLDNAELVGFEALLRWNHPERGVLSPGAFIALAEETGLINEIGEWAVKKACLEASKWPGKTRVAVNLSVVQLRSETLRRAIKEALALSGLEPSRLELEVTESVMLDQADENISALLSFRSMGIRVAMDDFGTGYSSMSGLRLFPFDKMKIDRSFVSELPTRHDCAAIVRSAASLAQSLGMSTTAEGIETNEQWRHARASGCTEGQGYLFGHPMPADAIRHFCAPRLIA